MQLPKAGRSADEIRAWIKMILRLTDWKASRLAQEAGLAPSTLNRFLAGSGRYLPSSKTLGRIDEAACPRVRQRLVDRELSEAEYEAIVAGPRGTVFVDEVEDGVIVGQWGFPENWLRFTYGTEPEQCVIIRIKDDAMAPDLNSGDQAIIDRRHTDPGKSGAGVYVLHTQSGWVARAIEPIPPDGMLRVSSLNKAYEPYEIRGDRLHIIGRIAGMWRRLAPVLAALAPLVG